MIQFMRKTQAMRRMKVHAHGNVDHGIWPLFLHSRDVLRKATMWNWRLCRLDLNIGIYVNAGRVLSRPHR